MTKLFCSFLILRAFDNVFAVSNERIRLQGPSSENGVGRVEVYYKGEWGTVTDSNWDLKDVRVVCRQLGYKNGVALQGNEVPDGNRPIWLNYVSCTGNEQSVSSCTKRGCGPDDDCRHKKDVGVKCSSTDIDECSLSIDNCHYNADCINTDGSFMCICQSGYTGSGTSCRDIDECSLSVDNCASNSYCSNTVGSFRCICDTGYTGDGTVCQDIDECSLSMDNCHPNSTCTNINGSFLCICDNGHAKNKKFCEEKLIAIQLRGTPSTPNQFRRVEVYYNGSWGTICDDDWDINDAEVVCRQLGYDGVVRAVPGKYIADGTGQIWLDDVACTGSEPSLSSCPHNGWGKHDCLHSSDAGVECSSTAIQVRLQGPLSVNGTGRVEVFYNGQWGTVCDDYWDISDAKVVCRQLGYTNASKALQGRNVPDGIGQIWLDNVNCDGTERNLTSCSHRGWGNEDCGHYEDAGVECFSLSTEGARCGVTCHPMAACLPHATSYSCKCKAGFSGNGTSCKVILPTLSFNNSARLTVEEGRIVVLIIKATGPLTIQIFATATVSVTNASDADFSVLSSTDLNFGPGNTEETIAIATNDDSIAEDDEIFLVTLSTTNPNVQIDKFKGVTTVTIQDKDVLFSDVSGPTCIRSCNTGVIVGGAVSTLVFVIMVVAIVACCFYRKKVKIENKRDADDIQNVAQCDMPPRLQSNFERNYYEGSSEYAQLDSCSRVPIEQNYQSLVKTRDDKNDHYKNIQWLSMRSNPGNKACEEDVYEEVHHVNS